MAAADPVWLKCRDCESWFEYLVHEQSFYESRGWDPPVRCRICREKARWRRERYADRTACHRPRNEKGQLMLSPEDRAAECETILRWDRSSATALFYTHDAAEAKRWMKLGYPVEGIGPATGRPHSWQARVPVAAVALLPAANGAVKAPRWLEPPTVWTPPKHVLRNATPENPVGNGAGRPTREETSVGSEG